MSDWVRTDRGTLIKRYGPTPSPVARGNFPTPMVLGDGMDPTEHVDGKFYDSKSAYRAVTKANGMVEVGNDPARFKTPVRSDIKSDPKKRREAVQKAVAAAGL